MKFILSLLGLVGSLISALAQPESRPVYNTGIGFFVKTGKLYDANGLEFIPYGVNSVHVWLNEANSKNLMLNIANEWGPDADAANKEDYLTGYKDAITRLRNAGIKNLLVVDAGGCGQDPRTLLQYADALLAHDPEHNLIAGIHLYGLWRSKDKTFSGWIPPYAVEDDIPKLAALETPVIVGEFGWTDAGTSINFNPEILVQTCYAAKMGWLFWAWHSNDNEPFYNISARPDLKYTSVSDLSNGGKFMVNDATSGFKKLAARATVFSEFVTATESKELELTIELYPNPTPSMLTLFGSDVAVNAYQIFSIQGNLVAEGSVSKTDPRINISDLPAGLYTIKIFVENQYATFKIEKN